MKIPIFKNTVTNYLTMAIRLIQGILVIRWLLAELGSEYYGLWTMLWSFFCYSRLLDFGFGVTAQKYTSVGCYRTDVGKYNRILSTIFSFHAIMAVVIAAATVGASYFVVFLFHLHGCSPEKIEFCRRAFLVFGLGSALLFPTGIFPEIMVGLYKIYVRNYLTIASKIVELTGIIVLFLLGGNLMTLIYFTLILNGVTNLIMWFYIRHVIPGVRLRLSIDREFFREIFHFSGFVYLCSIARLLWDRGSSLLISIFCGLEEVAYFQLGGKLPGLMGDLTIPYQENISPMTASFFARKKHSLLAKILLNSMRWNSFLATGMMVGIFLFASELLHFLFKCDNPASVDVCRWMVISLYVSLVFRAIPERFLMMAERHKLLSWTTLIESFSYFILCILLLHFFSIVSVVIGALAIKLITLLFVIGPVFFRYLRIGIGKILLQVSLLPLLATIPLIGVSFLLKTAPLAVLSGPCKLGIAASVGGIFYLLIFYFVLLQKSEKKRMYMKWTGFRKKILSRNR